MVKKKEQELARLRELSRYACLTQIYLKNVLPVVVPELNYEELEIQGGADAQAVWNEMIKEEDNKKKEMMITELKKYCSMDTLAMVNIHRFLEKVV